MGWNGSLSSASALGETITFTPDTSAEGKYTVAAFTAPKKGIYRFRLKGSGGTNGSLDAGSAGSQTVSGGAGGSTTGYLLLEKGETVYVGAGGTCSAAFASKTNASKLSAVGMSSLLFVAGGGGAAGRAYKTNYAYVAGAGGIGGGASGTAGADASWGGSTATGGGAGTQSAGGSGGSAGGYGTGGASVYANVEYQPVYAWSGRGGDGYYGGASGESIASHNSATGYMQSHAAGGGGGSGYVYAKTLTHLGKAYTSSTLEGGGAAAGGCGSVDVTFYARALLPVFFDGVQLERLIFNGTDVLGLIYNGALVYMKRLFARVGFAG